MTDTIQLPLMAKHFEGTEFHSPCFCAVSKAAMDFFNSSHVVEWVDELIVDHVQYMHEDYYLHHFNSDALTARAHNFDDTIIRTIILTKQG